MGKLGNGFEHFQSLDSFRKASFILGSEVWEDEFGSLLDLVKGFIVDVWELKMSGYIIVPAHYSPSLRLHLVNCRVSLVEGVSACSFGVCSFVNGSTHCSGCEVDGPVLWLPGQVQECN